MSSFSSDRDSRFEALRLIGIYFIILTHASAFGIRNVVGAILPNDMRISLILNYLLNFPGTFFNAVFVIVTGYFCIIRDVSYKRILVLAFQLCFYSWAVALLALLAGIVTENRWSVAGQALFSLFNGYNWFINCYIFFSLRTKRCQPGALFFGFYNQTGEHLGRKGAFAFDGVHHLAL